MRFPETVAVTSILAKRTTVSHVVYVRVWYISKACDANAELEFWPIQKNILLFPVVASTKVQPTYWWGWAINWYKTFPDISVLTFRSADKLKILKWRENSCVPGQWDLVRHFQQLHLQLEVDKDHGGAGTSPSWARGRVHTCVSMPPTQWRWWQHPIGLLWLSVCLCFMCLKIYITNFQNNK